MGEIVLAEKRIVVSGSDEARRIAMLSEAASLLASGAPEEYDILRECVDRIFIVEAPQSTLSTHGVNYEFGRGRWLSLSTEAFEGSVQWLAALLGRQAETAQLFQRQGAALLCEASYREVRRFSLHSQLKLLQALEAAADEIKTVNDELAEDEKQEQDRLQCFASAVGEALVDLYDKVEWHVDQVGLPPGAIEDDGDSDIWDVDYAAAHLGMYFGWLAVSDLLRVEDSKLDEYRAMVKLLKEGKETGTNLLDFINGGVFSRQDLVEKAALFTDEYYLEQYPEDWSEWVGDADLQTLRAHCKHFRIVCGYLDEKYCAWLKKRR